VLRPQCCYSRRFTGLPGVSRPSGEEGITSAIIDKGFWILTLPKWMGILWTTANQCANISLKCWKAAKFTRNLKRRLRTCLSLCRAKSRGAEHSPWQELEHLRIAQWDIFEFAVNPKHKSPKFPEGYWPEKPAPPDEKAWAKSARAFVSDRKRFAKVLADESTDLFTKIPHGDGQTILRQALTAADHNAYHLGQLVLLRRLLGAWK
jgi:hypothetical protein